MQPSTRVPRNLKVLLITEASDAGVGRHVLDLATGLLADGHEVHLLYSPIRLGDSFRRRLPDIPGLQAATLHMRRRPHPSDWFAVRGLRKYLNQQGPFDIVHGHSSKGGAVARLAGIGSCAKVVYTPHAIITMDPTLAASSAFIFGGLERVLGWMSDAVIATTVEEQAQILKHGLPAGRVHVVPNLIDPPDFLDRIAARAQLGLPVDRPVVGFVGRLDSQKDPLLMLAAMDMVRRRHPQALLAMIGDGPLEAEVRQTVQTLGLADHVALLGRQPAPVLMKAFDLFALSSRYEGMPYVLLEALTAGLPIVSTMVSSASLLVRHEASGLLVQRRTPADFSEALCSLLGDDTRRQQYAQSAVELASTFSLDRMVQQVDALYRRLTHTDRLRPVQPVSAETLAASTDA